MRRLDGNPTHVTSHLVSHLLVPPLLSVPHSLYRLYNLPPDEIAIVEGREAGAKKAPVATKPAKAAASAKKTRKSVLTEDPDLA